MEWPLLERTSEGNPQPMSHLERQIRRRKILIYRPSSEEQESSALLQKPLETGGACPLPCGDAELSPSKRQRLQQGPLRTAEQNGEVCGAAGETLWRVASPMEKQQRKMLAVNLEDFSTAQMLNDPQGDPQRSATSPCANPPQSAAVNEDRVSWSTKTQSSPVCRSSPPKGYPPSHREPQEKLDHARRQLWDKRVSLARCRASERLYAKRQHLQKGVSLAKGSEGTKTSLLEVAHQQILATSLEAGSLSQALVAGTGKEQPETSSARCGSDQLMLPRQSSPNGDTQTPRVPQDQCHQTDVSTEAPSWLPSASALLRPSSASRFRHWGLVPVFQSVRSKLEAFADIFLTPSKPAVQSTEGPPSLPPCPPGNEEQEAAQPRTPRQRVNIEVKIAISEPRPRKRSYHHEEEEEEEEMGDAVVSGRPPIRQWRLNEGDPAPQPRLGRSYSCPDVPGARLWQASPVALPLSAQLRQRRHTVCSLEVSRELGRPTPPCLRKEVYPFSTPPAHFLLGPSMHIPHCDGSPYASHVPSCCREPDTVHSRELSHSPDHGRRASGIGLDVVDSELLTSEQMMLSEVEMKGSQDNTVGKVSSIRIRKTPSKQQANLTPMGLPRPVRLNKKEFSLEEIYTNKNYRTPTEKRSFETIFEVPLERNGALIFTSQRKLKRAMEFQEGGLPRKQRKAHSRRSRRAAGGRRVKKPQSPELEEKLQQRLAELDALFEGEEC
ncbi:proline-rich protein 14 isoform X1 [Podarcis raffonei]|uniref:proline-rich protein 14 isoform X1 n=1 Tax=Podarcis raffonei TaxID=65483 RepID=UPI00232950A0|nr:proline-rich protein 14 isoform X1 [Podarcis raffonei]XP_053219489.1 proline-rich protein 14 isoform X1 [Podarcis raffonei]XP_053219490.1 proline-rich protein 14 isoform X1 [Podarcis raffonei]XP_053219491.1 proline-rich protein 14 isoform X1 [Podarcis raffonei]XP_053219492.1 proline-rich protein 14 isoform X1 [Podarcis raffonei]